MEGPGLQWCLMSRVLVLDTSRYALISKESTSSRLIVSLKLYGWVCRSFCSLYAWYLKIHCRTRYPLCASQRGIHHSLLRTLLRSSTDSLQFLRTRLFFPSLQYWYSNFYAVVQLERAELPAQAEMTYKYAEETQPSQNNLHTRYSHWSAFLRTIEYEQASFIF